MVVIKINGFFFTNPTQLKQEKPTIIVLYNGPPPAQARDEYLHICLASIMDFFQ